MEPSAERAVFKALLFSGDTESRAWSQLFTVLLQLKFVSDGVSVKLLAIHEQKQEVVYELVLEPGISTSMKSDFVQWHSVQSAETRSYGARFLTPSEADTFHICFQQLLSAVLSRHTKLARRSSDINRPAVIPHPSVRLPASLQLTISLPDGRRVTEYASHATRLRELLKKVCKEEKLPYKHHYLKPEKLRLDPEPAPLDMDRTVGELKISKLQLMDRRSEREMSGGLLSFSTPWGPGHTEHTKERDRGQIQLLQGRFNRLEDSNFYQPPWMRERNGMEFKSPTRVSVTGAEMVVSPVDSVDEFEISAPFRGFLQEERPKRSSSLRSRRQEQSYLDAALLDPIGGSRPSPRHSPRPPRGTFSESDIRNAVTLVSDAKVRPSTPTRRRAPKPPSAPLAAAAVQPVPKPEPEPEPEPEPTQETGTLRAKKAIQVPLFKGPEDVTFRLQDEFSQRLSERQSRSPTRTQSCDSQLVSVPAESLDSGLGNSSGESHHSPSDTVLEEVMPLASSTPDKRTPPLKPKPQIAPKPSRLLQSVYKPIAPSFPLYPTTPAAEDLLVSQNHTVRGVAGHVEKWRNQLNHQISQAEDSPSQQLVFHPNTSGVSESGALVFHLPPPPTDSPPVTPPLFRPSLDTNIPSSEPPEISSIPLSLIPPPVDDLDQSELFPCDISLAQPDHFALPADDVMKSADPIEYVIPSFDHCDDILTTQTGHNGDLVTSIGYADDVTTPYQIGEMEITADHMEDGFLTLLGVDQWREDDVIMHSIDDFTTETGDFEVTELEDLIMVPPPLFDSTDCRPDTEGEFTTPEFPPPTPLRMSLNLENLPDSPSEPPPPLPSQATDPTDKNAGLLELLTAAANSLTGNGNEEGTDRIRSSQASELVRAAMELISREQQSADRPPETLIRASYHQTDQLEESPQRRPPDFFRFGPRFQACMEDIRSDKVTNLKPAPSPPLPEAGQPDSELDSSLDSNAQCDVVSALAKAMKDRRLLLEQTSNSRGDDLLDPLQRTVSDDWK